MNCAVFTSSDSVRRQTGGLTVVTNWFWKGTAFMGFSKEWRVAAVSLAAALARRREYPTPTGEGTRS